MCCANVGSQLSTLSPSKFLSSSPQPVAPTMGYSAHLHQLPQGCCVPCQFSIWIFFSASSYFFLESHCFSMILKLFVSLFCVQRLLLIPMALLFSYYHNCLFLLAHMVRASFICPEMGINCLGWVRVLWETSLKVKVPL